MYLILFLAIALISYMVQANLQSKFKKFGSVRLASGMTGREVAEKMLRDHGITHVRVTSVKGHLTDHYNPTDGTVNLSDEVYNNCSVAAAAVAAHECGHAVQHACAYGPLQLRSALVPVVSFASTWVQWVLLAGILLVSVLIGTVAARRQETPASKELTVVTSFYPMYIATENVIGDATDVRLENLSEPQTGCLHDFQLTPEDMKLLSTADVFIINGGGIESFMKDVAAAYPDLTIIEACENVQLLAEENDENAHAWMSIAAYETQVQTIADELGKADAAHKDLYEANAKAYKEKLEPLKERQKKIAEAANGQNVILFHEAYDYVAEDYGLNVSYVLDLDEERQVSAGEIADVLAAVKKDHVKYILAEELYGKSTGDTIEAESDVKVLYLDPLNKGNYDADSYLEGMSKNMDILEQYLDR